MRRWSWAAPAGPCMPSRGLSFYLKGSREPAKGFKLWRDMASMHSGKVAWSGAGDGSKAQWEAKAGIHLRHDRELAPRREDLSGRARCLEHGGSVL